MGTVREYLDQSKYKSDFSGLAPGSQEFTARWRELAKDEAFGHDQYNYIKRTHYDVQVASLKADGVDLTDRGPAVQDALWSTAVQTRGLTVPIFEKGLKEKFGDQYELAKLSDKDIVEAVQDYKYSHTETLFRKSPKAWESLKERALQEKADLIQFAETGIPVDTVQRAQDEAQVRSKQQANHRPHAGHDILQQGSHGNAVDSLQQNLGQLGFTGPHGESLVNRDKHFGPLTRTAVETFQAENHLHVDGRVGPNTAKAIDAKLREHAQSPVSSRDEALAAVCLDNPAHSDHSLYSQARCLVHRLDRDAGRAPDQRSDNLAASITVAARFEGLERIDKLALSDDASQLWAGQSLGSMSDHFIKFASIGTMRGLNTPMEQSSDRWPHAMQQFQQHQATQAEQQTVQQTQAQDQQQAPIMHR